MLCYNIFFLGLFQKAIMQSGSVFNTWALNLKHKEEAFKLAKKLGCQEDNPTEILKYLKNVSAVDLLKASMYEVCDLTICVKHEIVLLNI